MGVKAHKAKAVEFREDARWHSARSFVYHLNNECTTGNNIEPENYKKGKGKEKRRLCKECARLGGK